MTESLPASKFSGSDLSSVPQASDRTSRIGEGFPTLLPDLEQLASQPQSTPEGVEPLIHIEIENSGSVV